MSNQSTLSVAIIARDEARHIGAALASVAPLSADLLVLLDSRTTDETASIASGAGARVVVEPWRGFSAQRNRALDLCQGEWVLFLDADERVSPELTAEIQAIVHVRPRGSVEHAADLAGFWIPRHNQFFGTTVRGGGWYPDHQLRLLRRASAHYDENVQVHERAQLLGEAGYLQNHIEHINIERVDEFWRKQRAYALNEAQTLYREGRRARWRNFLGAPAREFARRFVRLGGWRDGMLGAMLCGSLAYFELVKFIHLKAIGYALARQGRPAER